jgi:hypothetical protein
LTVLPVFYLIHIGFASGLFNSGLVLPVGLSDSICSVNVYRLHLIDFACGLSYFSLLCLVSPPPPPNPSLISGGTILWNASPHIAKGCSNLEAVNTNNLSVKV